MTKPQIVSSFRILPLVAMLFFVLYGSASALTIEPPELAPYTRSKVVFDHDAHNEKAGLAENCVVCHHSGEKGVIDLKTSSEGTPCSECHAVKAKGNLTPLRRAYHQQCIFCHMKTDKGPTACGECHK
ncbi:MAG: cytochrome c3 family protein [Bilophila sp.]